MPGNEALDEIETVPVNPDIVREWEREYLHLKLSTDLMGEAARYTCLLGSAFVDEKCEWNVDQAILGGHLVRLFKLIRHAIQQAVDDHADLLWVVIRLISESIVNLRYLQEHKSIDLFKSYLHQSLQHERGLVESIQQNIKERDGEVLPIEERMLRSIDKAFVNSGVSIEDLPRKKIRNWGGVNIRERARSLDLEEAYLGIFGGPSGNIHGSWGDLRRHQLEVVEPGRFKPRFDDERARPHPFYSLTTLLIPGLVRYAQDLGVAETTEIVRRLEDLESRVGTADDLHEEYLQRK